MSDHDPVCASRSEWRDIGHGVKIRECRNKAAVLLAIETDHNCPIYGHPDFVATKAYMGDGWDVLSEDPLTLSPSLLCMGCKHHECITNGKWVPA